MAYLDPTQMATRNSITSQTHGANILGEAAQDIFHARRGEDAMKLVIKTPKLQNSVSCLYIEHLGDGKTCVFPVTYRGSWP